MVTPTFATLDVGLPGGARHTAGTARSLVSVQTGDVEVPRLDFSFVGFDGLFQHNLGKRGRRVTWNLVLRCSTLTVLNAIIADIETAKTAGEGALKTSKDRTFARAVIAECQEVGQIDTIRTGTLAGWVRQEYAITFTVLSGD